MSVWASEVQQRLRTAGYRNGAARTALVDLLDTQTCCASAADLHDTLRERGRNVGLASVYRVLDSLLESGLVQRVDVGDGVARYEPVRTSEEHHHHLVCTGCGKVEAFTDPASSARSTASKRRAATPSTRTTSSSTARAPTANRAA